MEWQQKRKKALSPARERAVTHRKLWYVTWQVNYSITSEPNTRKTEGGMKNVSKQRHKTRNMESLYSV